MSDTSDRRADYRDNRRRLLDAASALIAERGPEGLSVSEVARRAGLNRTTAYAHFSTRSDLALAVKRAFQRPAIQMLTERRPIGEWVDRVVEGLARSPGMERLVIHDLLEGDRLNLAGWDEYTAWIQEIAKEHGHPEGPSPDFMARFLAAIVLLWPLLADLRDDEDAMPALRRSLPEEIKRLLVHGFVDPERDSVLAASIPSRTG